MEEPCKVKPLWIFGIETKIKKMVVNYTSELLFVFIIGTVMIESQEL